MNQDRVKKISLSKSISTVNPYNTESLNFFMQPPLFNLISHNFLWVNSTFAFKTLLWWLRKAFYIDVQKHQLKAYYIVYLTLYMEIWGWHIYLTKHTKIIRNRHIHMKVPWQHGTGLPTHRQAISSASHAHENLYFQGANCTSSLCHQQK